jgi:glucose-6-phosphate dehydrogenase assembly protein OpcA
LPWRELIAQFWDVPAWRARLRGIDRVEIDLGKPEGGRSNRAQALLLAGWLASRLGWHPRGMTRQSDGYVLRAARGRQIVEITIKIVAGQPSGVRAIRLINDSHSGTTFSVAAGSAEDALMRVQSDAEPPSYERVARLETLPEAELLAHELDTTAPDAVYEESLGAAAAFLTMPGAGTA